MPRKRKSKWQSSNLESFAREFTSAHKNMQMRINPRGELSLSGAIAKLIEPYKGEALDYNSFHSLVTYACLAWNMSILPSEDHAEMKKKIIALGPANVQDRLMMLGLINELMDRKTKLFPEVKRMIVEFKVTDRGNDFHIAIASTLEGKDVPKK
jgi:hypothetical protein